MTDSLAAYRRQRPRQIKLQLQHDNGFAAVDVDAALRDLLASFDAPFTVDMRLNSNGMVALLREGQVVEVITTAQLNRRYLIYLIQSMGDI